MIKFYPKRQGNWIFYHSEPESISDFYPAAEEVMKFFAAQNFCPPPIDFAEIAKVNPMAAEFDKMRKTIEGHKLISEQILMHKSTWEKWTKGI